MLCKLFWTTPQNKVPPAIKREFQSVHFDSNCVLTMCYWSNLLIFYNYQQMGQFQVGCAIKTGVWLTAADSICCLGFWRTAGDFLATYNFFLLSSFNSKMAWQQLHSHICTELRHWQEQTAVLYFFFSAVRSIQIQLRREMKCNVNTAKCKWHILSLLI